MKNLSLNRRPSLIICVSDSKLQDTMKKSQQSRNAVKSIGPTNLSSAMFSQHNHSHGPSITHTSGVVSFLPH